MASRTASADELNNMSETIAAFGDVPATFGELVDLTGNIHYNNVQIRNTLNQPITIKFGSSEVIFNENDIDTFDFFQINGSITYKYNSAAPTAGELKFRAW